MALKHTAVTRAFQYFSGLVFPKTTVTTTTVTTGTTPITLTADQVLGGVLLIEAADAGTATLPTAALLVAGMLGGVEIGTTFPVHVRNTGDSTLTIGAGTGGTISGTATIATANCKSFLIRITGVASGSEAYTAYSTGTSAF